MLYIHTTSERGLICKAFFLPNRWWFYEFNDPKGGSNTRVFFFTPKTMDSDSAPCVSQWMLLSKVDLARILDSLSSAGSPNNKNSFQKMEVKRKNFKHSTPSTLVSFRIGSFSTFMIMGGRVPFDYQVHFSQHECFWVVKCADFSVILDTIGILKGCSHLTWDVENPVNTGTNYRSLNWRSPDFWTINGCWTSFFFSESR